jgi:cytochrome oxidase Cu insertion factor (SCO1/SenC/PrrC family)
MNPEAQKPGDAAGRTSHEATARGTTPAPAPRTFLWAGLGLLLALLTGVLLMAALQSRSTARAPLPVYGSVGNFTLTNQDGAAVSLSDLQGHVWVADLIFTRCPGPCLKMTRQMKELQQALPDANQARLVSLTTDPDFDNPSVLKSYARRFGADPRRWMFLTGTKKQIASLAIDSLKLTAIEKDPADRQSPEDLFVHSTILVLVDRAARLRGIFETMGEGVVAEQVKGQVIRAVRQLEREP